jgi:ATP-binding cassette, subfamily C, bacterial exporter for protease/lipase
MLDPRREIDAALLGYRRLFGFLAMFGCVIHLLMMVPPLYMMQVYDRVLTSRNETTLAMLTLIVIGLFVLSSALEWIRGQIMVRMSTDLDLRLGDRVFGAAFERSLREHSGNPAQVLSDLASVRQFVTGPGLIVLFDAPWLPFYLIGAFLFQIWLGVFTLLGILILLGLAVWNELATRRGMDEANRLSLAASSYVNSSLRNAEVIQAMGMLGDLRARWSTLQQRIVESQAGASDRGAQIQALTRFVRATWQSLSLGLGALLVLEGQISPGIMIGVSFLLGRAMAPVEQIIGSWKHLDHARAAYQRLSRLLEEHPREAQHMPLPAPRGLLSLEQLSVVPPGSTRPAVQNLSLILTPGEALAVVGPSASGKSSLGRAIVGIWPASQGCVRIDQADIAHWSRQALGPHIGYLPQDVELFNGTVAENIARFAQVDAPSVIEAAQLAGIHDMILHFPDGYDTRLGAGGLGLSGGQRQRIGLARALYRRPALIVLDEPDASLDEAGEHALLRALAGIKAAGSTVLLITHRVSMLAVADKLLFLKNGVAQVYGPKEQVMRSIAAAPLRALPENGAAPVPSAGVSHGAAA